MGKRRRLLTPIRHKAAKQIVNKEIIVEEENEDKADKEVSTARGRLKGALLEVLEPPGEESDGSYEPTPIKRERNQDQKESDADTRRRSPVRQSYVLKLFDRSVDLSQFEENSPLYPICRAWMINQPKEHYRSFGHNYEEPEPTEDSIELPGPVGSPVSRIPELLPEQKARNKDNINLNYREAPPPTREQLLRWHGARWAGVRQAWLEQAQRVEARYRAAHDVLNKININAV